MAKARAKNAAALLPEVSALSERRFLVELRGLLDLLDDACEMRERGRQAVLKEAWRSFAAEAAAQDDRRIAELWASVDDDGPEGEAFWPE